MAKAVSRFVASGLSPSGVLTLRLEVSVTGIGIAGRPDNAVFVASVETDLIDVNGDIANGIVSAAAARGITLRPGDQVVPSFAVR